MTIPIQNQKWRGEIDLQGGRIVNLYYGDRQILGTYNRIDGKKGNTHICVPNFGKEGAEEFGLPFHGGGRSKVWNKELGIRNKESGIKNKEEGKIKIGCLLPKTEKYPADLLVSQTFSFHENSFIHSIAVEHKSGEPVPLNIGIHNYWNSPDGWNGLKVNGNDITKQVRENGFISLQEKNSIELPGQSPIFLEVSGFSQAVVWSGFKGNDFDQKYVCIEPVRGMGNFFKSRNGIINCLQIVKVRQKIII